MFKMPKRWSYLLVTSSFLGAIIVSTLSPLATAAVSRTVIRNAALVLTMDPAEGRGELGIIKNADVLLVGDTIAAVGNSLRVANAHVVNAAGKIVMPGFVDA